MNRFFSAYLQTSRGFLRWLDENILVVLSSFLLAFIPLYPKIPLWSPIEQYIVRVRLEDIFILLTVIIWGVQVWRKKVRWHSAMFWMVLAYAVIGMLSTLSALFITHTVPLAPLHVGKTVLHYFRYLEYFSLFFVLFSSVRSRKDVTRALFIFAATVLAVAIYGYGQKYFYWPVYSTMNREFSKGIRLYLTEYARVQSTFAGHYDMASYLVISLPLLLAFAYRVRNRFKSTALHWIFWVGSWLVVFSASRTPFAAYVFASYLVVLLVALSQSTWKQKVTFLVTRGSVVTFFLLVLCYYFGGSLIDRLSTIVNSTPPALAVVQTLNSQRQRVISDEALADSPLSPKKLQEMLPKAAKPQDAVSTADVKSIEDAIISGEIPASVSDVPPTPAQTPTPAAVADPKATPSPGRPADVYVDVPEQIPVTTISPTGEKTTTYITRSRVYSDCALKKELSLCIRLETLWPRAIDGFYRNPLLGSGYATLTKETVDQFTEADSTDNNFLRTLGETGILGFITFYGCVGVVAFLAVRNLTSTDRLRSTLSIGILCGTLGLLINAVYIDVFAASKVALTYWSLAGLYIGYLTLPSSAVSSAKPTSSIKKKAAHKRRS